MVASLRSLIRFYTTFRGRIVRRLWWFGMLPLMALGLGTVFLTMPAAFSGKLPEPGVGSTLLALVFLVPVAALTFKRLNDRDHPSWVGRLWVAIALANIVLGLFGIELATGGTGTWEFALYLPVAAFNLWVFIDNGFLKGTPGPNRHGPDPVMPDGGPRTAPTPLPTARRRAVGAYFRDGVVGLFLLMGAIGFPSAQSIGKALAPTLAPVLTYLFFSPDLREFDAFHRNEAGQQAWTEAMRAMRAGETSEALRLMDETVAAYGEGPGGAYARRERARVYRAMGRNEEALADAEAALALRSRSADSYKLIAEIQEQRGDLRAALAAYDRAVAINADDATLQIARGDLLLKMKRRKQSFDAFDRAVALARAQRDRYAERLQDPKRAGAGLERLLAWQREELGRALAARGTMHRDAGRDIDALADFEAALKERPGYAWALVSRGWLHEMGGELDRAREDYRRAAEASEGEHGKWAEAVLAKLERGERRSMARRSRGNLLRRAARYDEALAAYDDAVRLDPDSARPYLERGWLHFHTKSFEQTVVDETRALARDATLMSAYAMRGAAYHFLGREEQALVDLDKALSMRPDDAFSLTYRGNVHEAQGRKDLARADYEAAAERQSDVEWLDEALRRVR